MINPHFLIAFLICLGGYILHTIFHFFEYKGYKFGKSKLSEVTLTIVFFFGYIGWGFMIATDPVKIMLTKYVAMPLGLAIGLSGILLFIFSTKTKKGFNELDHLVTKGIYSKIRNPMYLGVILIHIGFPLAVRSLLTLGSAIIWISIILFWKYMEEMELKRRFGDDYSEYKKKTIF